MSTSRNGESANAARCPLDPKFDVVSESDLKESIRARYYHRFTTSRHVSHVPATMHDMRAEARHRHLTGPTEACGTRKARANTPFQRGSKRAGGEAATPARGLGRACIRRPRRPTERADGGAADGGRGAGGGVIGGAAPAKRAGMRAPSADGSRRAMRGQERAKGGVGRGGGGECRWCVCR